VTTQSVNTDRAAKKAEAARTGDETCVALWAAVNVSAGLIIAVLYHRRARRACRTRF
jgi:hypothetical protein